MQDQGLRRFQARSSGSRSVRHCCGFDQAGWRTEPRCLSVLFVGTPLLVPVLVFS